MFCQKSRKPGRKEAVGRGAAEKIFGKRKKSMRTAAAQSANKASEIGQAKRYCP
jgi:hypothetical protein